MQNYFFVLILLAVASAHTLLMDEEPMDFSRERRQVPSFDQEPEVLVEPSADTSVVDPDAKQALPSTFQPHSEDCVYTNNRQFLGLVLYVRINVASALVCGNTVCSSDPRCTHFTYNPNVNGGTCTLCSQPGSGGTWSVPTPPSSHIVCGHIPRRSCNPNALISICLGLDLGLGLLGKK
ncbi:hypothetical protein DAPPUDRAFT_241393 [Daphnia pulex]|uniref:Uncharacterized protein n=1 Tax=Daphnia pulex TaxID=6669 RepID=E9GE61_DAPPU|nr:hypothetical protein DAPPUDRAFT_241393 [Daphnia pulex]|eukprot:EFX82209.1 hypothetical protein DAPPUDRAFT_241393 [Daphnia pulex]